MSTSHIDPDRLTDTALGTAALSDAESAHVAGCAECRLELELVIAASRLGAAELSGVNSGRLADAVRARLVEAVQTQGSPVRRPARWTLALALAAALTLAVVYGKGGWPGRGTIQDTPAPAELSVLHELDDLEEPELEAVLESIPLAAGAVFHPEPAPLDELNVNDLERVLRSMEE